MLHLELVVASPPILARRRDSMLSRFASGDTDFALSKVTSRFNRAAAVDDLLSSVKHHIDLPEEAIDRLNSFMAMKPQCRPISFTRPMQLGLPMAST